jgi:hypothetical protein
MPLSTVLGAQSVVKPGVCTTATRPASPFQGQMIYDTTVAQTLVWSGSAWIGAAGKVAQVVSTTKTDAFSTTSTSYVDVTGLSVSITPTSATSTILVITGLALSAGAARGYAQLVRGATNIAISTGFATSNQTSVVYESNYQTQYVSIAHVDSPATTSATTYKFQVKADSGSTCFVNAQAGATSHGNVSTLTVMEILA